MLTKACSCQLLNKLCADGLFLIGGFNKKNLNATAKTGEFKQFDYGEKNQEKYNQPSPPFYGIEDMTMPTALWSDREDWVTSASENERLLPHVTNLIHHESFPDWSHWDHIWSLDAPQHMYRKIVDLMEKKIHETSMFCPVMEKPLIPIPWRQLALGEGCHSNFFFLESSPISLFHADLVC